jgi:GDP-L-fucose synthase
VDDLAGALVHLMRQYEGHAPVNVACSSDVTIRELAELMALHDGRRPTHEWFVANESRVRR